MTDSLELEQQISLIKEVINQCSLDSGNGGHIGIAKSVALKRIQSALSMSQGQSESQRDVMTKVYHPKELQEKLKTVNLKEVSEISGISYDAVKSLSSGRVNNPRIWTLIALTKAIQIIEKTREENNE